MAYEKGDEVMFIKDVGGFRRPCVSKGTKGVVTKAAWWWWWGEDPEITTANGRKLRASRDEIRRIGRKSWWQIW